MTIKEQLKKPVSGKKSPDMLTMLPINEDGTWSDKQRKVYERKRAGADSDAEQG